MSLASYTDIELREELARRAHSVTLNVVGVHRSLQVTALLPKAIGDGPFRVVAADEEIALITSTGPTEVSIGCTARPGVKFDVQVLPHARKR